MYYGSLINPLLPYAFRAVRRAPMPVAFRKRALELLHELHDIYDPQGGWRRFVEAINVRHLSFDPSLGREEKKRLFKDSVDLVEFEPHAYCNRRCTFCPNVFLDRLHDDSLMDIGTYRRCIEELKEIGYDQTIRFARYCEPLACKDIFEYVSIARRALPKAEIDIVTNGDYLDRKMLARLAEAGLSTLRISIYPKGYVWDVDNAFEQLGKVCTNAGVKPQLTYQGAQRMTWEIAHPTIKIIAQASDLGSNGYDRGQLLNDLIDHGYRRKAPCPFVFANLTIDFDRSVMPCCNLRGDMPQHKKYIVDTVEGNKSLFDIYYSKGLTGWRQSLVRVDRKGAPCNTCKHRVTKTNTALFFLKREINSKLKRIGLK